MISIPMERQRLMGKRNLYLNNTPVEEARMIYENALKKRIKMDYEEIPTEASLGRITKEAVFALCSSPLFNARRHGWNRCDCRKDKRCIRPGTIGTEKTGGFYYRGYR